MDEADNDGPTVEYGENPSAEFERHIALLCEMKGLFSIASPDSRVDLLDTGILAEAVQGTVAFMESRSRVELSPVVDEVGELRRTILGSMPESNEIEGLQRGRAWVDRAKSKIENRRRQWWEDEPEAVAILLYIDRIGERVLPISRVDMADGLNAAAEDLEVVLDQLVERGILEYHLSSDDLEGTGLKDVSEIGSLDYYATTRAGRIEIRSIREALGIRTTPSR